MKRILNITSLLLLWISGTLQGAEQPYPAFMSDPKDFAEEVKMTSDRDIYFTNETLFFEAALESVYPDWSKIIYVEIISYTGNVHYQAKYKINENKQIDGTIALPDDITTGYYYLRAYTKWMRNYSPYNYFYKPILLINAHNNRVLSVDENYSAIGEIDTIGINFISSKNISSTANQAGGNNKFENTFKNQDWSSLSLIKESLITPYSLGIKKKATKDFHFEFLPEIEGLSITGTITNDSVDADLDRAIVFLSILGDTRYSSVMYTDQWGKFYFNLKDDYGHREAMISVSSQDGDRINFLIDNDFCNKEVKLPFISPLSLSKEQWESLSTPNINAQLEQQLIKQDFAKKVAEQKEQQFYTEPTLSITLDDYIEMPTLKDYIYELIPTLGIRYKNDIPRIIIRSSDNVVKVKDYNAIIIYDGMFINDIKSLLDISPRKIERIEVLNQVYIMGDNVFGGIVNVKSKDKNIENLNLNNAGLFIDYMMLHDDVYQERIPLQVKKRKLLNNNTVLWSSKISSKNNQILTPDREGNYLLISSSWDKGQLLRKAVRVVVE